MVAAVVCAIFTGWDLVKIGQGDDPAIRAANSTAALAQLKKYSVAQNLMSVEFGRMAHRLPDLYEQRGFQGVLDRALLEAWVGSTTPVPLSGYLFADITEDESGAPLDPWRCGLSAFPAEPGISGARVLLLLIDESEAHIDSRGVGRGGRRLFQADVVDVPGPVTRWPTQAELDTHFKDLTRSR